MQDPVKQNKTVLKAETPLQVSFQDNATLIPLLCKADRHASIQSGKGALRKLLFWPSPKTPDSTK